MSVKIAIGGDHAGFLYKGNMLKDLIELGYDVTDFGPSSDASVDYPDYVHPLAKAVEEKSCTYGILICGSGNGVAITANKHAAIRAGLCWNTEVASLIRQHNDANVICIPARFVDYATALDMVKVFLSTAFEGGRHATRVGKITAC